MMVKDPLKDSRKEFDDKVRSSKGTKGLQKIKIFPALLAKLALLLEILM